MKFIDLFSGLGGFHVALSKLGHECVFASEIDETLRELYEINFGLRPIGDIREHYTLDVPKHSILTGGFPCQAFSKAGFQAGLDDFDKGTLFDDIARILKYRRPKYFILENVANLKSHDEGRTFDIIMRTLSETLNYSVDYKKLSPHQFGIPQLRERIFIVGCANGLSKFQWPEVENVPIDITDILDKNPEEAKILPDRENECLDIWQEFLDRLPSHVKLPSFPIWSMEFGADYPFKETTPYSLSQSFLDPFLGSFGQSLYGMLKKDQLERLPKYARLEQIGGVFPRWKILFISQNREFYKKYKRHIDPVLTRIQNLPPSWQKFEWNCQGEERQIRSHVIQFRGSGVRVKRTNYSPSLVASTSTQIPVIAWENRYMTITEAARLQSLDGLKIDLQEGPSYKALGNAVNARVVELIAENLIGRAVRATGGMAAHIGN
ncbi:MAG: DNA (cytosine-5-)-methyltransferase [Cyclobacteriaceae bacterium]